MLDCIEFDEPEFQQFFDYWNELRGTHSVPVKSTFDPLRVSSLMAVMSVTQWTPPDKLYLRLMGTDIVEQTHIETTGTNLLDIVYEPQRPMVMAHSAALFSTPAIGLVKTNRCFTSGKTVEVKFAFFPFRRDAGEQDIAIGVHKADLEANRRGAQGDPLKYAEVLAYNFLDIGNGAPDLSFNADG